MTIRRQPGDMNATAQPTKYAIGVTYLIEAHSPEEAMDIAATAFASDSRFQHASGAYVLGDADPETLAAPVVHYGTEIPGERPPELQRADDIDAETGVGPTRAVNGYAVSWPTREQNHVAVSLDGEDLFDALLYEDDGESLTALRSTLARTLNPAEAEAVGRLLRMVRGSDDVASGPLAALYQRLTPEASQ
jgi:hypothetical protein